MKRIIDASLFLYLLAIFLAFTITVCPSLDVRGEQLHRLIVEEVTPEKIKSSSLPPFQGPISARDFYNYYNGNPNTGLEEEGAFALIPYKSPSGATSLIVTVDDPGTPGGGEAELTIRGLPRGSQVTLFNGTSTNRVKDNYIFSPPYGRFHWNWKPGYADGVIISGLSGGFELEVGFKPIENVTGAVVISGNLKSPEKLKLNEGEKIRLSGVASTENPEARFTCPRVIRRGEKVEFDASRSINPNGRVKQYSWNFDGDGFYSFVSQKPTARHSFTETGTHRVNLRITTEFGNRSIKSKTIKVTRNPIKAIRHLSTNKVLPGGKVRVRVEIVARQKISGIGLKERIPEGREVKFKRKRGVVWKPSTNQWLLKRRMEPGEKFQISYTLKAPSGSNVSKPGSSVNLSGVVSSAFPELSKKVVGESRIEVRSKVKPLTALAHYDPESRDLDFKLPGKISDKQLNPALRAWRLDKELPLLGGFKVDFRLIKEAVLYHQKGAKVSEDLSQPETPEVEVNRSIETGLPKEILFLHSGNPWTDKGGNSIEFKVTVKVSPVNRTLMGVGLDENLPKTWTVVPEGNEEVVFKPAPSRWIVRKPILPGEKFSIDYRVKVPLKSEPGKVFVSGKIKEGWSGGSIAVRGDRSLKTVEELPPKVVISKWDVNKGKLDFDLDNHINASQSEKAISFWVRDLKVPFTGGEKISFSTVEEITALYLEDKPVGPPS